MKRIVLKGFITLWAFCFLLACATQNKIPRDTEIWGEIKSEDDLAGVWEGFVILPIRKDSKKHIPKSSLNSFYNLEYIKNSREITFSVKIDFDKFLTDMSKGMLVKMAGFTKDSLWELFLDNLSHDEDNIIGDGYSVMQKFSEALETDFSTVFFDEILINEKRNKIKILYNRPITFELGDMEIKEIILDKK